MSSPALKTITNGSLPLLNLQRGWPSTRLCARACLLAGAEDVLAAGEDMAPILLYGPGKGHPQLRESIATWLSTVYSTIPGPIDPRRICITNGASASLANITMKFADPTYTRRIFMVEPTYFLACPIFEDCGFRGRLQGVPEGGANGIDLAYLEHELRRAESESDWPEKPRMKDGPNYPHVYRYVLYCTTTFTNPSAKTWPNDIREGLVKLARKYDMLVVSDDVYDFLSWSGGESEESKVPPRLVDCDRSIPGASEYGNAISNGSFAKIIGPGIRVGWVEATPSFVSCLGLVGSTSSGGAPSHFASTIVERSLRNGSLQAHVRERLIPEYRNRYSWLMATVETGLLPLGYKVESSVRAMNGGYFTYLRVPDFFVKQRIFAKTLAAIALRDFNLRIAFGHMFVVAGDDNSVVRAESDEGFAYCMRLCWAWLEVDELIEAISRLAACTKDVRARIEKGEEIATGLEIGIR